MPSKVRAYDKNFIIVGKRVKHRLNKKSKLFYQIDKYCSEMSSNELETILNHHNNNKKEIMESKLYYAENLEREFRSLQKMVRDWMEFTLRIEQEDWGKEAIRLEDFKDGALMTSKGAITYEYNEDETEIIVRDGEGNIIDKY